MVVTTNFNVETFLPSIIAIAYYAFVFFFAEIIRKFVGLIFKRSSLIYAMLIELIGTAQMCTCVYENSKRFFYNFADNKFKFADKNFF
jgi:hypothetical protein